MRVYIVTNKNQEGDQTFLEIYSTFDAAKEICDQRNDPDSTDPYDGTLYWRILEKELDCPDIYHWHIFK
jgi:hypothetical protein